MQLYYLVDVFAAEPSGGNAAAVVLDADGMSDEQMQLVAKDFNLSETTFVLSASEVVVPQKGLPADEAKRSVRFRWFTPSNEVDMCGHATIAGVHAMVEAGLLDGDSDDSDDTVAEPLSIETRSGELTAFVEQLPGDPPKRVIWLELLPPQLRKASFECAALAKVLGMSLDDFDADWPPVLTQDRDAIVFVRDTSVLNGVLPAFDKLSAWQRANKLRGLCLATTKTLSPSIHVQSRFFAPADGVNEDPVTGSVHGPLAAYLVERGVVPVTDGTAALQCVQGIPGGRTGLVWALVRYDAAEKPLVRIGGFANTVSQGQLPI